jgi:hypothetical protein
MSAGTLGSRLTVSSADTKVHGKLGVGGDPDNNGIQLLVTGSGKFTGSLQTTSVFTAGSGSASYAINVKRGSGGDPYIQWNDTNRRLECGSAGFLATKSITLKDAVSNDVALKFYLTTGTVGGTLGSIVFGNTDIDTTLAKIQCSQDGATDSARLTFHTTEKDVNPLVERLRIKSDGTQDHYANRIVNSQTVSDLHRTAEPSLRFDGTTVDTDYVDCGTTGLLQSQDLTIAGWFNPDASQNTTTGVVTSGSTSGSRRGLELYANDWRFYNASGNIVTSAAYKSGVWQHVVATVASNEGGNTVTRLYVDGVEVAVNTATAYTVAPDNKCLIGDLNSTNRKFSGEMKDVRIHNRALEDTEVAAAYNGESTPFKYADAGAERLSDNSFTGLTSNTAWVRTGGWSYSEANDNAAHSGLSGGVLYQPNPFTPADDVGLEFVVTFTIAGNTASIWIGNAGGSLEYVDGAYNNYAVGTHTVSFTLPASQPTLGFYVNSSSAFTIDDISCVRVGEVAAYTPQSINELREITYGGSLAEFDTWCDTTSNGNHGKITGATIVGNNHVYAPLTVKGRSEVGDKNLSSCGSIWLGDHATNRGLIDYDEGTGQGLLRISSYRDADSAKLELATYRTPRLDIDGLGTVRATNSGGSLKQVARVHVNSFTLTTSETFEVITHNLGTSNIVVSVRTDPGNGVGEIVEVAVNTGDENNATVTNKCTLRFASAPAADTGYMVTVIG